MAKGKAKQQQLQLQQQQLIKIQQLNQLSKSKNKSIKSKLMPRAPPAKTEKRQTVRQPVRRSLLMRKALQPLLPPRRDSLKKRNVLTSKAGKATKTNKRSPGAGNALILVKDMPPCRTVKSNATKSKKAIKKGKHGKELVKGKSILKAQLTARTNALGKALFHAKRRLPVIGQHMYKMPMPLPEPPMPQPPLPHLSGGGGVGVGSGQTPVFNGYGYKAPQPVKQAQTNIEVDVPLTTRLPIIDFISTDEFERMYASKMHRVSRRQTGYT